MLMLVHVHAVSAVPVLIVNVLTAIAVSVRSVATAVTQLAARSRLAPTFGCEN